MGNIIEASTANDGQYEWTIPQVTSEECLVRIVEAAVYMTKAEEGFLLLLDEDKKELTLRAGKGLGEKFTKGFQIKSGDSVVWQVIKTAEPTILSQEQQELAHQMADQLAISVGDLFLGAVFPGLILSASYLIFIIIYSFLYLLVFSYIYLFYTIV